MKLTVVVSWAIYGLQLKWLTKRAELRLQIIQYPLGSYFRGLPGLCSLKYQFLKRVKINNLISDRGKKCTITKFIYPSFLYLTYHIPSFAPQGVMTCSTELLENFSENGIPSFNRRTSSAEGSPTSREFSHLLVTACAVPASFTAHVFWMCPKTRIFSEGKNEVSRGFELQRISPVSTVNRKPCSTTIFFNSCRILAHQW